MTVNPKTVVPEKIKTLLFPTDFSQHSKEIFESILAWAAKIGAQLILFHRFEGALPLGFYGEFGLGIDASVVRRFERDAKLSLQKHTQEWKKAAAEKGVKLRVISSEKFTEIADGVLDTAREHEVGAIILANHRGPLGQAFFGSAARNVLAQAKCPVLVIHT
jgi:nucleotide-binding universal stress UspA family protein